MAILERVPAESDVAFPARTMTYSGPSCPRCGGGLVRSQRRWWDTAIRVVTARRPFRCFSCQSRRWWHMRDVTRLVASSRIQLP